MPTACRLEGCHLALLRKRSPASASPSARLARGRARGRAVGVGGRGASRSPARPQRQGPRPLLVPSESGVGTKFGNPRRPSTTRALFDLLHKTLQRCSRLASSRRTVCRYPYRATFV